jgi:hypothetical protein
MDKSLFYVIMKESKDFNIMKKKDTQVKYWNGQTYRCSKHGLITGDNVGEDEVDYGILRHWCLKCSAIVDYLGFRNTPSALPIRQISNR